MSDITIRRELAEIGAMIRSAEMDNARIKLHQLQKKLHELGNHKYDLTFLGLLSQVGSEELPKTEEPKIKEPNTKEPETSSNILIDEEALGYLRAKNFIRAKAIFAKKKQREMAYVCTELINKSKILSQIKDFINKISPTNKKQYRTEIQQIQSQLLELKSIYLKYEIPTEEIEEFIIKINNIV